MASLRQVGKSMPNLLVRNTSVISTAKYHEKVTWFFLLSLIIFASFCMNYTFEYHLEFSLGNILNFCLLFTCATFSHHVILQSSWRCLTMHGCHHYIFAGWSRCLNLVTNTRFGAISGCFEVQSPPFKTLLDLMHLCIAVVHSCSQWIATQLKDKKFVSNSRYIDKGAAVSESSHILGISAYACLGASHTAL